MSRTINRIIIHCSDSAFGSASLIDSWHKERGWKSIGYHYVIQNGRVVAHCDPATIFDGNLEEGRNIETPGAHCEGENQNSIGICLIGVDKFTENQFQKLTELILRLMKNYQIPVESILGHYETLPGKSQGKTCPNFDMEEYRKRLIRQVSNGQSPN